MIAVDTSALAAILFHEPEASAFLDIMAGQRVVIGAPTKFELQLIVVKRQGSAALTVVDEVMTSTDIQVIPFSDRHVAVATEALQRFGGRPARLNYGDCMAYAVAKIAGCPLLYKGGDFALTDVAAAR